jgi:hypothetical protein
VIPNPTTGTDTQPDPDRARALAQVYTLLCNRARGSGLVIYRGFTPMEGTGDLVGVADVQVGNQRGLVAVRLEGSDDGSTPC